MSDKSCEKTGDGWVGVDLDGTLASIEPGSDVSTIGPPVVVMADRLRGFVRDGRDFRIVTARVAGGNDVQCGMVEDYVGDLLGLQKRPVVTASKDYAMTALWDDRAVQVVPNTGLRADGLPDDAVVEWPTCLPFVVAASGACREGSFARPVSWRGTSFAVSCAFMDELSTVRGVSLKDSVGFVEFIGDYGPRLSEISSPWEVVDEAALVSEAEEISSGARPRVPRHKVGGQ